MDIYVKELETVVLVKVTGKLAADLPENQDWVSFLSRDRRRVGDEIDLKPKDKFGQHACALMEVTTAIPVDTPTTT